MSPKAQKKLPAKSPSRPASGVWSCRMAEPLVVRIPHKLGKEEALRRVKPALAKASSSFPVLAVEEETWSGDRLCFGVRALGQIAAGNVEVAEDHVQLEVTLPWLLHKFALLEKK
jgi:Putative polyhydroxyalkanoic acid system protein (PHA_gran_rgn)